MSLTEKRLLLIDKRDAKDVVEVAHEALLRQWDVLVEWLRTENEPKSYRPNPIFGLDECRLSRLGHDLPYLGRLSPRWTYRPIECSYFD